jgi:hypothetical protein
MSPNAHALPKHVSAKIDRIEIKDGIAWVSIRESTIEEAVHLARKFGIDVGHGTGSTTVPSVKPKTPGREG